MGIFWDYYYLFLIRFSFFVTKPSRNIFQTNSQPLLSFVSNWSAPVQETAFNESTLVVLRFPGLHSFHNHKFKLCPTHNYYLTRLMGHLVANAQVLKSFTVSTPGPLWLRANYYSGAPGEALLQLIRAFLTLIRLGLIVMISTTY